MARGNWRTRAVALSATALWCFLPAVAGAQSDLRPAGVSAAGVWEGVHPFAGATATLATVVGGTGSGPATGVAQSPYFIALDGGRLVATDLTGNVLRSVDLSTGVETTVAGSGYGGYSGDGGPATGAQLNQPAGVAVDGSGDVFVSDQSDARLREIPARDGTSFGISMKAGDIYTIAGNGNIGFSGDNGPATAAELGLPEGIALDGVGDVIFADTLNGRVREVAATDHLQFGLTMVAGDVYTIAGDGQGGKEAVSGDGGPAVSAGVGTPQGVSVDGSGDVFVTQDFGENNAPVREVAAKTQVYLGQQMAPGDIYTVAGGSPLCGAAVDAVGDGCPAATAMLEDPVEAIADPAGDLYITDYYDNRVRFVDASTGTISTYAGNGSGGFGGDGGPATAASLSYPTSLALGAGGRLFVSDSSTVRQIDDDRIIKRIAGNETFSFSGDGGPSLRAQMGSPRGTALDAGGALYFTDSLNNVVRVVPATGGTYFGVSMAAGSVHTIAGLGTGVAGLFAKGGFAGDGGPASTALLARPSGIALDVGGDVFIADSGNARVREIAASDHTQFGISMLAGDIYTVAGDGEDISAGDGGPATGAGLFQPTGIAVDSSGDLFVAESSSSKIREVAAASGVHFGLSMSAGNIYTVAGTGEAGAGGDGGPASAAQLDAPSGLATDGAGDLFVADTANDEVREVVATGHSQYGIAMTSGDIYTIAGSGRAGFGGDGATATRASLNSPAAVAVDRFGNLWISDTGNHRLREVSAGSGGITTVAGTGRPGFSGDGGAAGSAEIDLPAGIAFDAAGNPLVAEFYDVQGFAYEDANGRVVKVTLPASAPSVPSEPVGVTAEPGRRSVTVRWSAPASDGGSAVSFYSVVEEPDGLSRSVPAASTSLVFPNLAAGSGYTFAVAALNGIGWGPFSPPSAPGGPVTPPDGKGYSLVSAAASTSPALNFGSAAVVECGSGGMECATHDFGDTVVASASTPDGSGLWTVDRQGTVYTTVRAVSYGTLSQVPLARPIVAMASTPDGEGYWLVASDGGVFAFGDAGYFGSTGGTVLNEPVVGIATTADGQGYWLVASDGGVFAFGDAGYYGSAGNLALNEPIVAMAPTPDGGGYWFVASDGGVFAFGDAGFYGSAAGTGSFVAIEAG